MMLRKILIIITLFSSFISVAQTLADYNLVVKKELYTDLDDPISLAEDFWDDPDWTIDLPFEFTLIDRKVNQLVNDESFGMEILSPDLEVTLFPMITDAIDRGIDEDTSLSSIGYQISGEVGNRVVKIEWRNAGLIGEEEIRDEYTNFVNIQVWFYELDESIELRYGKSFIDTPDSLVYDDVLTQKPFIGVVTVTRGAGNESFGLNGDVLNPEIKMTLFTPDTLFIPTMGIHPPDSMVYRFEPMTVSNDAEPTLNEKIVKIINTLIDQHLIIQVDQLEKVKEISIYDSLGKLIMHTSKLQNTRQVIDCSIWSSGIYFVSTKLEDGTIESIKVLKQ